MAGERVRKALDREPIWRRAEDKVDKTASNVRNTPGKRLRKRLPSFENRNFGGGLTVGVLEAAIALILKETVGVPFGSDVEVVDTEPVNGGLLYTINVDAPFSNMAEAQAFFEAGTGFSSLLTDLIRVESTKVVKHRVARDTYQIEVLVED